MNGKLLTRLRLSSPPPENLVLRTRRVAAVLVIAVLAIVPAVRGEIDDQQVRRAIDRGVAFLKSQQRPDGSWTENTMYPGGITSLCTLALINSGVAIDDPAVQRSLNYLRGLGEPSMVYSTSLQTMVFCRAEPEKDAPLIRRNVEWLERAQITSGTRTGAWRYSLDRGAGDNSNTQFALLALHEAEQAGITVDRSIWERSLNYWLSIQKTDGSWGYYEGEPSTGSMTCAGISSVIICSGQLNPGDARVENGQVDCCAPQVDNEALQRALEWMGRKFSPARNPMPFDLGMHYYFYYLYGVERVGRLTGQRFLGRHDWYREGAEILVGQQDGLRGLWRGQGHAEGNPLIASSFALLFLAKGRRPVVIGQLQHDDQGDWNHHRSAVAHLTRRVEQRWKRELTWQTVDIRAATVEDLLQSPVLFLSGRDGLQLNREQRESLKQYVEQGGFVFAEAACQGKAFDREFRALMAQLFPDSPLRILPPEHPVWWAEQPVDPDQIRPLYGIDACCRTSIVYCPEDLSCYWELAAGRRVNDYPKPVQQAVEACLRIGENVITYATNRELKNKLDRPRIWRSDDDQGVPERAVLMIPQLIYQGGGDDAPNALPNLLAFLREQTGLRVRVTQLQVDPTSPDLFEYPVLFIHGRRAFRFSSQQRQALATFLERGGVIFANAICASPEFADSFRREMQSLFPDVPMQRIPPDHELFSRRFGGFDVRNVTLRDPEVRRPSDPLEARLRRITPLLEGLTIDERIAVIFSPYDISCALESGASLQCKGYIKEDAARLSLNVILFALQQ